MGVAVAVPVAVGEGVAVEIVVGEGAGVLVAVGIGVGVPPVKKLEMTFPRLSTGAGRPSAYM